MTKSRSGARLVGQAPPRVRHAPNVRANSWEDVSDLSASLGLILDDWQEDVLRAGLGERSDGQWASRIVGVSAPRQQGKSQLIVSRALAGIMLFGEQTIICSAHQTDTAREVFQRLLDIIEDTPALSKRVESVMRALNREHIRFKGGQVIKIKARSVSGSRGFSADCLLLDEAQILGASAWASILPTMSARENPQAWLFGTPPTPADDGDVFSRIRQTGLDGRDSKLAWLEWSADAGDDLDDPLVWAKANPAYGTRISHEAIEAERGAMDDEQFARERLGMWDEVGGQQVIPADAWDACTDTTSRGVRKLVLGVDVNPDQTRATVSLAALRADGLIHLEMVEQRTGVGWMPAWIVEKCATNAISAVVIDKGSPAAPLIDELKRRKVRQVRPVGFTEHADACSLLLRMVLEDGLRHTGQPQLTAALAVASKRTSGDRWLWNRKNAASDITPLVAATLAVWGVHSEQVRAKKRANEQHHDREAVILA